MKRAAEFLLGGALVYVAMAAQAAGCGGSGDEPEAGPLGASGQGGAPDAGGGFGGAPGAGGMVAQAGRSGAPGTAGKGGSGPVPDADAATPGSRLKPKVFVGADGSKQPTMLWHDTQRNEECSFRRLADGSYRCMPTSSGSPGGYYQDSGCTAPVLAVPTVQCGTVPPPSYIIVDDVCGTSTTTVYDRGALSSTAYVGSPGNCVFVPAGPFVFYQRALEVPLSSFVAAELRVE